MVLPCWPHPLTEGQAGLPRRRELTASGSRRPDHRAEASGSTLPILRRAEAGERPRPAWGSHRLPASSRPHWFRANALHGVGFLTGLPLRGPTGLGFAAHSKIGMVPHPSPQIQRRAGPPSQARKRRAWQSFAYPGRLAADGISVCFELADARRPGGKTARFPPRATRIDAVAASGDAVLTKNRVKAGETRFCGAGLPPQGADSIGDTVPNTTPHQSRRDPLCGRVFRAVGSLRGMKVKFKRPHASCAKIISRLPC